MLHAWLVAGLAPTSFEQTPVTQIPHLFLDITASFGLLWGKRGRMRMLTYQGYRKRPWKLALRDPLTSAIHIRFFTSEAEARRAEED